MKPVPPVVQDTMDKLRRIEYDLSRMDQDKVTKSTTGSISGCVETFRRTMLNHHGIEIPVLPDSHFAPVKMEIVFETEEMPGVTDGGGELTPVTTTTVSARPEVPA